MTTTMKRTALVLSTFIFSAISAQAAVLTAQNGMTLYASASISQPPPMSSSHPAQVLALFAFWTPSGVIWWQAQGSPILDSHHTLCCKLASAGAGHS